jgi:hypothetical protein
MASQTVDILVKARDQASGTLGKVGNAAGGMGSMLKAAAGLAAAFVGTKALIDFGTSSVKAFMESQDAVNGLEAALDLLGKKSESAGLQAFAEQIQQVTTADDEAVIGMMKIGAAIGNMSGDTLKQATVAAMGLSKAYGMDLESAMTLVSKAAVGNTGTMGRYGIVFKEGMSDTEKFNQVLEVGRQKFAMAEAETQTFSGKIKQLGNAWENAKEQLGGYIANSPLISGAIDVAVTAIQNLGLSFDILTLSVGLGLVSIWEEFKYMLTIRIPATWDWFRDNWFNLLTDMLAVAKQVVSSLAINFGSLAKSMWDMFRGKGWNFEWTGLLEGFEATTKKFPDVMGKHAATAIENSMGEELEGKIEQFYGKMSMPKTLDKALLGGPAIASAAGVEQKKAGVAAVESRFLSGQTTTQDYTRQLAGNSTKQTGLLERIAKSMEKGSQFNQYVSNFAEAKLV